MIHTIDKKDQEFFRPCLELLKLANNTSHNKIYLKKYIWDRFSSSPKRFFTFIHFYKEHLLAETEDYLRKKLATYYLEIFSPLCLRFNFFIEKNNMDDLCFQITEPKTYYEIYGLLLKYQHQSKLLVAKTEKVLKKLFSENEKIPIKEINGRYKNIYSIYKKIQKRKKSLFELNDIFAFRIILKGNRINDCFKILNYLHDRFEPVVDFFNDYITIPKINGYQSLHTGLKNIIPGLDLPVEIQIRTEAMHDLAENGLAAHWIYAQDKRSKLVVGKEAKLMKYLSCQEKETTEEAIIYCLSYDGDIARMEKNTSVLDFAYQIHTDIGNRAAYALVNGQEQPLNYIIQEGDHIRIVQAPTIQIQENWLKFVKSKNALKSIADYLKRHA